MSQAHSESQLSIRDLLIRGGDEITDEARAAIAADPERAGPVLIAVMMDEEWQMAEGPGAGMAPIHAAKLLGELGVVEAIEPMLELLEENDFMSILFNVVIQALIEFGEAVLEPALQAYEEAWDDEYCVTLLQVLCSLGVRDERIYECLLAELPYSPSFGAGFLADYGDERALPVLEEAFWGHSGSAGGLEAHQVLIEIADAIVRLGGVIDARQRARIEQSKREHMAFKARWDALVTGTFVRGHRKVGRNEPCPCGSGKKYKKCCLVLADNA